MLQLLLASIVVLALLLLSASSFRLGQKSLGVALLVLAITMTSVVSWVVLRQNAPAPSLAINSVELRLDAMHPTAVGWRLEGEVANRGETDISSLTLAVVALDCDPQGACDELARREFDLLLNVPAGKQYPVRYPLEGLSPSAAGELRWQLEAVKVLGYAEHP